MLRLIKSKKQLFTLEEVYTGLSPLHVSIRENKLEFVNQMSLRKDFSYFINSQNNQLQWAPIHFAASVGNCEILSVLLSAKPNLSIFNSEGCSAIHISTSKGHKAFVENLLEKGVHVDEKDKNDWTALHYAASQNLVEMAEFLVTKGAKTSANDKNGLTPLFAAICHGHLGTVEYLYNYKDGFVNTCPLKALHIACGLKDPGVLEFLHNKGEDLWEVDNSVCINTGFQEYSPSLCSPWKIRSLYQIFA